MKLAVSNIAWPAGQRDAAYELLRSHGITGLEIAPALFLDGARDVFLPTAAECDAALAPMRDAGFELVSMQSLLFGVQGAELFGRAEGRERFEAGMSRAITLAGQLGVPNLVFGSPRQRVIPDGMSESTAEAISLDTFRRLGDAARAADTILGMEFNPPAYGTNFLTHAGEAAAFVKRLKHPSVRLILDIGALHMNDEFKDLEILLSMHAADVSHVHLSEPNLAPAPAEARQAARVLRGMDGRGYTGWYSIEMKAQADGGLTALAAALGRLKEAANLAHAETAL